MRGTLDNAIRGISRVAMMAAFAFIVAVMPAIAQETTGTLKGRIVDAQGLAVPGVTVTATGPQGVKTAVTDTDGRFSMPFLTPGTYAVRAELQGFKAIEQSGVNVSLGQTVDLASLKMEVGGLTETVQVTGATPVVDTSSTTTGAVLSSDMFSRVPVGRRVSDTLYMAPGVSSSGSVGSANPSISGGSGLENQYVVDGVNVTNQGYGALGSYSIVFGSLGNATPFDFVKEVQVKTGGYEAEFGQATGGVVNVVTKSGSNAFRGSVFGYSRPTGTEGDWTQVNSPNGTINTESTRVADAGAEGGGPIMKDHAFFFGALDPSWERRTFLAPPGFPLLTVYPGGADRDRRTLSYSAKGTFQLSSAHRIDASFFGDPSKGDNGPQRTSALLNVNTAGFSSLTYGGHNQTVRYEGVLSPTFLAEVFWARALNDINETPSVNAWRMTDTTVVPNIISGGIGGYEAGNHSLNNQYVAKFTNILGGHSVKYGVEFDDVVYSNINQRTGPTFTAPDGRQTATGASISIIPDISFGRIYRVTRANFNSARTTTQKYWNFFVQDTWKFNRLTINPGIRYEQEKMAGTIITDFQLKNNWAPRLGATYDLTGDGKTKVFGNFGIFYSRVPNDLAARALSADDGFTRGDYFDSNLSRPVPNGTATQTTPTATPITNHFIIAGTGADTIDPDAKLSYVREFVLGFEREVLPYTTAGVRYINRRIPRVLEDVANCPMVAYEFSAATASVCGTVEYILTNPSSATPINPGLLAIAPQFGAVKFDDPVHKYDAVEFTLNRRMANNWSMLASYRWSRLRGNFEGFYRDDNGQSDPGISSLYDFPTNDPTYAPFYGAGNGDIRYLGDANGILPLDRPHQGKVFGNYQFPMGLNVGLGFNVSSGKPLTLFDPNPNYGNGGEIPDAPRGSGINTKTLTGGSDGFRTRTPVQSQIDFQAAYSLRVGGPRRVTLMADIFNLFNQQTVLDYDNWSAINFGDPPNPNFGLPVSSLFAGNPPQFQTPRQIRFGVRFEF
ncbi:MAG TPA: TonB-dependent receptor [Vicinamibacterales bacterium]|nr:TonB-dependent receptor [Vicinamibacterales bacterium]